MTTKFCGKTFGFFAQGIDPAGLPSTVRRIQVAGPDGSSQTDTAPREHVSLNFTRIETTYGNDEALSIDTIISFPPSLTPVMSAPSWSADGSTLFMTLADANGTPSIYALQIGNGRDVQVPLLVADNAFDPAVAPNGRYLAFVRNDPTGRNIYALELNRLQENPITQQMQGAATRKFCLQCYLLISPDAQLVQTRTRRWPRPRRLARRRRETLERRRRRSRAALLP